MPVNRILLISFELPNLLRNSSKPAGGVSTELLSWIEGFRENGLEVGLLSWKGSNTYIGRKSGINIIETYNPKEGIPKLRVFYNQIPSLFNKIKKYNPDIVFQEGSNLQTFMLSICSKILNRRFVHRLASDMDVDDRVYTLISRFEAKMYRLGVKMADHISCQNEYQYVMIKKKYPNKPASISHNPFIVKNSYKKLERKYIAWVGNFRYAKNLPSLAQIAQSLPQYIFKIAGGNFEKTDEDAEQGLKKLKMLPNVEFAGYIKNDEMVAFLNKAFLLLNTSRTEGFSNTFLEAWTAGTPVITTENVNPDNLIRKFNLGAVAESYEELPEVIDEFIKTKKYEKISENCYHYVVNNHNPEKLAAELLKKIKLDK